MTVATVTLWAGCAFAQTVEAPNANPQRCKNISELANALMEARQLGTPMSQLIRNEKNDLTERISNKLVADAYAQPRLTSESAARRAIEDFENEAYRSCYAQIRSSPTTNAAQSKSTLESSKYCQEISRVSGGSSQIEAACLQMEAQAQRNLITMERTAKAENYCHSIGVSAGGSYRIKEACLKQEQAAAATLR